MATIKYLLQSKKEQAPIYCRLSINRDKILKRKTGFNINPDNWLPKEGIPKAKDAESKALKSSLVRLDQYIFTRFNEDQTEGVDINGDWLEKVIADAFGRKREIKAEEEKRKEDIAGLVEWGRYIEENLDYKVSDRGSKGVSVGTRKKYKTIINKLEEFDKYSKKEHKLVEVDLEYRKRLIDFFSNVQKLSDNTVGRYIKHVKTIVLDARKNGLEVNPMISEFKGYTVPIPKVTLSFEELERIKELELDRDTLDRAKDWLLIGCYTGQRVSDLLRMKTSMIERINNFDFIVLEQVKTGKLVQIPVHSVVKEILDKRNGQFPSSFANTVGSASTLFNRYVKEVCRLAGINEPTEGNLYNPEIDRYVSGTHEKWKLVSSHICRRSFATNFYSVREYPTPLLMNITAHATEKVFLEYIGKKPIDYSMQLAEIWRNSK